MEKMKNTSMSLKKYIIEIFLLLGYAVYSLYLYFSNKIYFFVHPDYAFLALLSGILLSFLAVVLFIKSFITKMRVRSVDCCTDGGLLTGFNKTLLILPLCLALIFQPKPLSSAIATTRNTGSYTDAAFSRDNVVFSGFTIDSRKRSLVDWIRLFSQDPEPDHYKDLKAKLVGFVMRDPNLPENYFQLSRFVISCCAADARPIGIPVKYDSSQVKLKDDQWIEVEAHFEAMEIEGQRQPVLVLESFKTVDIPENPYAT